MGDWNGDGIRTVGVYRSFSTFGRFYLRNSNNSGSSWSFNFGLPGDEPVVGDWNGDGRDGLGVVRSTSGITFAKFWYLSNTVNTPSTVASFRFGAGDQRPAVWTVRLG